MLNMALLRRFLAMSRRYLGLEPSGARADAARDFPAAHEEERESMNEYRHQIIVAAVLERDGRFLVVEEMVRGLPMLNQPAGRLERGEAPPAGAVREAIEESGVRFAPTSLVGIYEWYDRRAGAHYLRLAYTGEIREEMAPSDRSIIATHWLTPVELAARERQLHSPFVLQCVRDYLEPARRYPLDLVRHFNGG